MRKSKLIKTIALTLALSNLGVMAANAEGKSYWQLKNNKWYYYTNGAAKTGWINDKGNWYYCYENGVMAKDTTVNGYYLNSNGAWSLSKPQKTSSKLKEKEIFDWNGASKTDQKQYYSIKQ